MYTRATAQINLGLSAEDEALMVGSLFVAARLLETTSEVAAA